MGVGVVMEPSPGERRVCFVGDRLVFELRVSGVGLEGGRGLLRTTIGAGVLVDDGVVRGFEGRGGDGGGGWRDVGMVVVGKGVFRVSLVLGEVGFFRAKAFWVDGKGRQFWADGDDFGVSVHPGWTRCGNLIYCAWVRLFGEGMERRERLGEGGVEADVLEGRGYAVLPPSGRFRDLRGVLDHVIGDLGCRVLHLLPVNPTPSVFGRFGRFGSPYAALDLTGVDLSLVVFDGRSTGVEQFCELVRAVHLRGARVFIDLVVNHTGWGSRLHEGHPGWFRRGSDGGFVSPGAWGTVWEDLVEFEHGDRDLGVVLAEAFLVWCRRGVDGFRCDAGYMVPVSVWRYVTARVRREFPETVFLLEGLGGSWEVTELLLTEGGMQWAYSEMFQCFGGEEVGRYVDYVLGQCGRVGLYVHYSETHDNERLGARGRGWSLLRNRLCGLVSVSGGFGFTCGVEWLASEKVLVHGRTGLGWGSEVNVVGELGRLNGLLGEHPCFFDGASVRRVSGDGAGVLGLVRVSREGLDRVLVVVNLDVDEVGWLVLSGEVLEEFGGVAGLGVDLLGQVAPVVELLAGGGGRLCVPGGGAFCLGGGVEPVGLCGDGYRARVGLEGWVAGLAQLVCPWVLEGDGFDVGVVAGLADGDVVGFLGWLRGLGRSGVGGGFCLDGLLDGGGFGDGFCGVVLWEELDGRRVVLVPPGHWLVVRMRRRFVARLGMVGGGDGEVVCVGCVGTSDGWFWGCFDSDGFGFGRGVLEVDLFEGEVLVGGVLFLSGGGVVDFGRDVLLGECDAVEAPVVLLTNGRGGMARLGVDFGCVKSKYDCLLGANLDGGVPVDRHVLAKRVRVWVNAGGFVSELGGEGLVSLDPGPPARWVFLVGAGRGCWVPVEVVVDLVEGRNEVLVGIRRLGWSEGFARAVGVLFGEVCGGLAAGVCAGVVDGLVVSASVRVDLEDRGFHGETVRSAVGDGFFEGAVSVVEGGGGFVFRPGGDRCLRVVCDVGLFHLGGEWSGSEHVVELSRGQVGYGDGFSPGWFELGLGVGEMRLLSVCGELDVLSWGVLGGWFEERRRLRGAVLGRAGVVEGDDFGRVLVEGLSAFVVRRGGGWSVVAGYPWFLDWGRDSLVVARGLLGCGFVEEAFSLLGVLGGLEVGGTLPNCLFGDDVSNRESSDAPLWFGLVCRDFVGRFGFGFLGRVLDGEGVGGGDSVGGVLRRLALGYLRGASNGVCVDGESGLVWSPAHFSWMDTNFPAGTPREGYPVEVQVLWILLLRLLADGGVEGPPGGEGWGELAGRALGSFERFFWLEEGGYYGDVVLAGRGVGAGDGVLDGALRCNFLLGVGCGLLGGVRARRGLLAALRFLLVPGGLRSLAPLRVGVPLEVRGGDGGLLNDPWFPYWGRYVGGEDVSRKPAYHNGTVWCWWLGVFCEGLARAWGFSDSACGAARAYLGSAGELLGRGCVGFLPEVLDGDAPHVQRGCDAQAWSVSEVTRVWRLLGDGDGERDGSGGRSGGVGRG